MTSIQWILLDNLVQGWPPTCNLTTADHAEADRLCRESGYIVSGKITSKGRVARLTEVVTDIEGINKAFGPGSVRK